MIVAENPDAARPLELAAAITPDPAVKCVAEVIAPDGLTGVEWEKVALVLWQAPLPEGEAAAIVQAFVDRGGRVIFFPPRVPTADSFLGVRWGEWANGTNATAVDGWRSDQDLLAQTQSGASLPGRRPGDPQVLPPPGRNHRAGHPQGRRAAAGPRGHQPGRGLLLRHRGDSR